MAQITLQLGVQFRGFLPAFQNICLARKTLVICDEHHHAAIEAAWGTGAFGAFEKAQHVLVLTGNAH